MKKIISFVFILCMMILPYVVKADMGVGSITSFKVRVINPDGADIYDEDYKKIDHYDYEKTIEITGDGEKYYDFDCSTNEDEWAMCYVKTSDVALVSDTFDDFSVLDKADHFLYVFDNNVYLYKGPSIAYDKVSDEAIPAGTVLQATYCDSYWSYVEYNGKKGFVFTFSNWSVYDSLSAGVAYVEDGNDDALITVSKAYIYAKPNGKEVLGSLSAFTKVKVLYSYAVGTREYYYYIDNGNNSGWVSSKSLGYEVTDDDSIESVLIIEDTYFVSSVHDYSLTKTKIPAGTELDIIYYYEDCDPDDEDGFYSSVYYVNYNGHKGWIVSNSSTDEQFLVSYEYEYDLESNYTLFDYIKGNSLNKQIEAGQKVIIKYSYVDYAEESEDEDDSWFLVYDMDGNELGWINDTEDQIPIISDEQDEEAIEDDTEEVEKVNKLGTKLIIILCVTGAVVIALCGIVIIILFNKKNKKDKDVVFVKKEEILEKQEEASEEEQSTEEKSTEEAKEKDDK